MHAQPRPPAPGRRDFLKAGAVGAGAAMLPAGLRPRPGFPPDELEEITVARLQAGMEAGRWSAREIAERYLRRIEEVDRGGPALRSVIEINSEALAIAAALDAERRARGPRGPLHGIPVLLKDNVDTGDRMRTSAGSLALARSTARRDAFLVERLRAAGAVVLGKTNLSEWANFRSTRSVSGWSARGGQTRNPWALDRNPCGSSSGSAAAVSANLAALAVGTETDGSIVCPASSRGIVGVKPTVGLVSRRGIIPIAHSQDTAGPMSRTVADAALLLSALAGEDPEDPATRGSRRHAADYAAGLDAGGLRGARIGVARKLFGFDARVDRIMEDALRAMREAGAVLVEPADIATAGRFDDSEYTVLLYEFKHDLEAYLATRGPDDPRTLDDLIAFNEAHRAAEMPFFGQEIFLQAVEKGPLTDPAYRKALAANRRLARTEGIDRTLAKHRLDAIVAPTGGPAWLTDPVTGDHFSGGSSSPAAVAGTPAVTVPAGYVFGLPVGATFMGAAWSEGRLLRLAHAFEQATSVRRPPPLLPTANLETVQ